MMNATQSGAVVGSGLGALTGAVIGGDSGHAAGGALLGAAIGGVAGASVGHAEDHRAHDEAAFLQAQYVQQARNALTNFDLIRLAQSDHIDNEGMYQLAVARLMVDGNGGRAGERKGAGDATMGYFSSLVRDGFPLAERLKKEGQLSPDDLFRVGRHFASGVAQERRFGGELLHHVADKHARRKVGEEAKLTLRAEGL